MPNFKNIVKVKDDEKRLYRIFKDLEQHRECIIEGTDKDWHGTMRKFGIRSKEVIAKDLLEPIWIQRDVSNVAKRRLIRTKKDVDVVERKNGNKSSFFHFKRRKII